MIKNLKKLRTEKGVSQQQLASVIGISQQSVNKYENHNIEPDIFTLCALADYFDTSIDYLVGRVEIGEPILIAGLEPEEIGMLNGFKKLEDKEKLCVNTLIKTFNGLKR